MKKNCACTTCCGLSLYGWTYWFPILVVGVLLILTGLALPRPGWILSVVGVVGTFAGLAFFRDFPRAIPADPGLMVSPADGTITHITRLDHYEPFGGPALMVGMFLSVLDVHVNRAPCESVVLGSVFQDGQFLDARHPECGIRNQANTLFLGPVSAAGQVPADTKPIAVVKQIVGAIARRIVAPVTPGQHLARGERFGMICFGSRTELYVPAPDRWEVRVQIGQHVKGGCDVLLQEKAA